MIAKFKRITEDTDLDALLDEPGWTFAGPAELKEMQALIREAAKNPPLIHRGGARAGAGRKPVGRMQYTTRLSPTLIKAIKARARREKRTECELVEAMLTPLFS